MLPLLPQSQFRCLCRSQWYLHIRTQILQTPSQPIQAQRGFSLSCRPAPQESTARSAAAASVQSLASVVLRGVTLSSDPVPTALLTAAGAHSPSSSGSGPPSMDWLQRIAALASADSAPAGRAASEMPAEGLLEQKPWTPAQHQQQLQEEEEESTQHCTTWSASLEVNSGHESCCLVQTATRAHAARVQHCVGLPRTGALKMSWLLPQDCAVRIEAPPARVQVPEAEPSPVAAVLLVGGARWTSAAALGEAAASPDRGTEAAMPDAAGARAPTPDAETLVLSSLTVWLADAEGQPPRSSSTARHPPTGRADPVRLIPGWMHCSAQSRCCHCPAHHACKQSAWCSFGPLNQPLHY